MRSNYYNFIKEFIDITERFIKNRDKNIDKDEALCQDYISFLDRYFPRERSWNSYINIFNDNRTKSISCNINSDFIDISPIASFFSSVFISSLGELKEVDRVSDYIDMKKTSYGDFINDLWLTYSDTAKILLKKGYGYKNKLSFRTEGQIDEYVGGIIDKKREFVDFNKKLINLKTFDYNIELSFAQGELMEMVDISKIELAKDIFDLAKTSYICGYDFKRNLTRDKILEALKNDTSLKKDIRSNDKDLRIGF